MCEIGATSGIRSQLHYNTKNINNNINLFVNCDLSNENFKFLTKNNSTTLNFNTHKVEKTISHIHVPTTSHFEKTNFLINLEGIVQKSYKATTPFKKAHNVEDTFKSIIKIDDIFNKYSKNINQFTNRNFLKELP